MKVRKEKDGRFTVSLERGDDVIARIEEVATDYGIYGGVVKAIGAVQDPQLGYYKLSERKYLKYDFPGAWELAPLEGNLSLKDGKPFLHAHVTIGDERCNAKAGHLFRAEVAVVVEVTIMPGEPMVRLMCDDIGLHRWEPRATPGAR